MKNLIEEIDSLQQKYMKGILVAIIPANGLLFVRYLFGTSFREYELNSQPIGIVVLLATVVLLITTFVYVIKLALLKAKVIADPHLKEALIDNELCRLHIDKSFKAGFIGTVVTPYVFLFLLIDDPVLVAFSTSTVGSVTLLISLYLRNSE